MSTQARRAYLAIARKKQRAQEQSTTDYLQDIQTACDKPLYYCDTQSVSTQYKPTPTQLSLPIKGAD